MIIRARLKLHQIKQNLNLKSVLNSPKKKERKKEVEGGKVKIKLDLNVGESTLSQPPDRKGPSHSPPARDISPWRDASHAPNDQADTHTHTDMKKT